MLLNFTIQNWKSYKDTSTLNMISSLERHHSETLTKLPGWRSKKVLPVASIYGANAAGKTGVIDALACLRKMIVTGTKVGSSIPVQPFALDEDHINAPTVFDITILISSIVYEYYVEATSTKVEYESLSILRENKESKVVFSLDRQNEELLINIDEGYFQDNGMIDYVVKGTRENQLFLNNAIDQNIKELQPVYDWFKDSLTIISAGSNPQAFAHCCVDKEGFMDFAARKLREFGTGIVGLEAQEVNEDSLYNMLDIRQDISQLKDGEAMLVVGSNAVDYTFLMHTVHKENGRIVIERLKTIHKNDRGENVTFELVQESSGTLRLMGLLPMILELTEENSNASRVFVVDELDRCLHTMLTNRLVQEHLDSCGLDSRKQLIFTTHDLLLMNQSLMRRDEMHIAQCSYEGASELVALDEFEGIRHDKDLIKSYLEGRFGGIPEFSY